MVHAHRTFVSALDVHFLLVIARAGRDTSEGWRAALRWDGPGMLDRLSILNNRKSMYIASTCRL